MSRWVKGGTAEKPIERDEEWLQAQRELEVERLRKEDIAQQTEGKSLFEVLQQNKAAKQEAFEESIKLKNQFRKLDDDEVDFLDSVLESTRAKEDAVKRETQEQLALFRKQQEETDKSMHDVLGSEALGEDDNAIIGDGTRQFSIARKRKRVKGPELLRGVKLRRTSLGEAKSSVIAKTPTNVKSAVDAVLGSTAIENEKTKNQPLDAAPTGDVNSTARIPQKTAFSLIDYTSEDEEDPN